MKIYMLLPGLLKQKNVFNLNLLIYKIGIYMDAINNTKSLSSSSILAQEESLTETKIFRAIFMANMPPSIFTETSFDVVNVSDLNESSSSTAVKDFSMHLNNLLKNSWKDLLTNNGILVKTFLYENMAVLKQYPYLINRSFSVSSKKNITPLWLAASFLQWEVMQSMLKICPDANVNASPAENLFKGKTPLWLAASFKQWELVSEMIAYPNADINMSPVESSYRGISPLFLACYNKQWKLVQKMLRAHPNADINMSLRDRKFKGKTPLWYAAYDSQWGLISEMMVTHPNADVNISPVEGPCEGLSPFLLACRGRQWELMRKMLKIHPNADIDARPVGEGDIGITPFLTACYLEQWELVFEMLKVHPKANINIKGVSPMYTIAVASDCDPYEILEKKLLQKKTPLELAKEHQQLHIVSEMTKTQLNTNKKRIANRSERLSKYLKPYLFKAIKQNLTHQRLTAPTLNQEIISYTALQTAVKNKKLSEVKSLFSINKPLTDNRAADALKALEIAIEEGSYDIFIYLFEILINSPLPDIKCLIFDCYRLAKACKETKMISYLSSQRASHGLPLAISDELFEALYHEDYSVLVDFILEFKDFIPLKDFNRLLLTAAREGSCFVLKLICGVYIKELASLPNIGKEEATTLLHTAAHTGQAEMAKLLIEICPGLLKMKMHHQTPMLMAKSFGHEELAKILATACLKQLQTTNKPTTDEIFKLFFSKINGKSLSEEELREVGLIMNKDPSSEEIKTLKSLLNICPDASQRDVNLPEVVTGGSQLVAHIDLSACSQQKMSPEPAFLFLEQQALPLQDEQKSSFLKDSLKPSKVSQTTLLDSNLPTESSEGYLEEIHDKQAQKEAGLELQPTARKVEAVVRSSKTLERKLSFVNLSSELKAPLLHKKASQRHLKQTEEKATEGNESQPIKASKNIRAPGGSKLDMIRKVSKSNLNQVEDKELKSLIEKKVKPKKTDRMAKFKKFWRSDKERKKPRPVKSLEVNLDTQAEKSTESYRTFDSESAMSASSFSETIEEGNQASYKNLMKLLAECALKKFDAVKLEKKTISSTLRDLEIHGIITCSVKGNTLSATKNDNQHVHLTAHMHSSDRFWYQKADFTHSFLDFVCQCDPELGQKIKELGFTIND